METKTIDGIACSVHKTKTANGTIEAGYAYVPIIDNANVLESFAALVDDGKLSPLDIAKQFRAGCAIDLQAQIRGAKSDKWNDKMMGDYFGRVSHDGDYAAIVQRCKQLFADDCKNNTTNIVHRAPWGIIEADVIEKDDE